MLNSVPDTF